MNRGEDYEATQQLLALGFRGDNGVFSSAELNAQIVRNRLARGEVIPRELQIYQVDARNDGRASLSTSEMKSIRMSENRLLSRIKEREGVHGSLKEAIKELADWKHPTALLYRDISRDDRRRRKRVKNPRKRESRKRIKENYREPILSYRTLEEIYQEGWPMVRKSNSTLSEEIRGLLERRFVENLTPGNTYIQRLRYASKNGDKYAALEMKYENDRRIAENKYNRERKERQRTQTAGGGPSRK